MPAWMLGRCGSVDAPVALLLLCCRCCGKHFAICRSCYQGHVCCSDDCASSPSNVQHSAGMQVDLLLLCCPRCGQHFAICRSCYRRHVYCSDDCADAARLEGKREYRKNHRKSEEGRLDHRDREKERRRRRKAEREARVGDHTSHAPKPSVRMPSVSSHVLHEGVEASREGRSTDGVVEQKREVQVGSVPPTARHRCAICGRAGYLVDCFPGSQTVMRR